MDFRSLFVVLALVSVVAGDAHAQLAPGDACILKDSVKASAKPKGKGKTITLDAGTQIVLDQVRGKWMKLIANGAAVWLKRGKLKNMCGGAEVVDDPVFEPDAGLDSGTEAATLDTTENTETTETGAETIEAAEVTSEPLDEAEPAEPEDEADASSTTSSGGVDIGALAGLGLGGQGGNTRLTFDLVIDGSWRVLDSIAVGARLFLHGTPGVGYGFGGLTGELRYFLPTLGSIEPYAQAGIGAGYGAAGSLTAVFVARLAGGGRMFVWDRLFISGELAVIISQLSVAGQLDVGAGWSF